MAKAIDMSNDPMTVQPVPLAAQDTPEPKQKPASKRKPQKQATQQGRETFQLRWPEDAIREAKIASLVYKFPSVSDFMIECVRFYKQNNKGGTL